MEIDNVFKTSLYTIFIPLENESKEWMIVHGYTGAIDIVNNEIAQFLRSGGVVNTTLESAYTFSPKSLEKLIKRGYLTDKKPVEEKKMGQPSCQPTSRQK